MGRIEGNLSGWIIVQRELAGEARRTWATYQRLVACAALALSVAIHFGTGSDAALRGGGGLFLELNLMLFSLIWFLVPLMAFDTLSRERRERTLELLYLTRLRPIDVVIAKASAVVLRTVVCLSATFPVMMMPVVMGGVTLAGGLRMVLLHGAAVVLALVASLWASARHRDPMRASVWALIGSLSCLAALGFLYVVGSIGLFMARSGMDWSRESLIRVSQFFFQTAWNRLPFNQPGLRWSIAPFRSGDFGGSASWGQVFQAAVLFLGAVLFSWFVLRRLSVWLSRSVAVDIPTSDSRARMMNSRWGTIDRMSPMLDSLALVRVLMGRYRGGIRALGALVGVSFVLAYWGLRFGLGWEAMGEKLTGLILVIGGAMAGWVWWIVREERWLGTAEILVVVPGLEKKYWWTLLGVGIVPGFPALLLLGVWVGWQSSSVSAGVMLVLMALNTALIGAGLVWVGGGLVATILGAVTVVWGPYAVVRMLTEAVPIGSGFGISVYALLGAIVCWFFSRHLGASRQGRRNK